MPLIWTSCPPRLVINRGWWQAASEIERRRAIAILRTGQSSEPARLRCIRDGSDDAGNKAIAAVPGAWWEWLIQWRAEDAR
jgi:hypothetical protein